MSANEDGATSVEYALVASLVAAAVALSVATLGDAVVLLFQSFNTAMGW